MPHKHRALRRFLFLSVVLLLLGGVYLFTPLKEQLTPEKLSALFDSWRSEWWFAPLYIAVMSLAVWAMFPAFVFTVAAGVLFGPWLGIAVAWTGTNLGAWLAFESGRSFLHDFVARHVEKRAFLRRLNRHAAERGFLLLFLARLVMVVPWNVLNYLASLSRVSRRDYLLGTLAGTTPEVVLYVAFGALLDRLKQKPELLAGILLVLVLLISGALLLRKRWFGPDVQTQDQEQQPPL